MATSPVRDELRTVKIIKAKTGEKVRNSVVGWSVPERADGQTLTANAPHAVGLEQLVGAVKPRSRSFGGHGVRRGSSGRAVQVEGWPVC